MKKKDIIDFSGGGELPINEFPLTDKICEIKNTKYSFFLAIGEQGIYTISKIVKRLLVKLYLIMEISYLTNFVIQMYSKIMYL